MALLEQRNSVVVPDYIQNYLCCIKFGGEKGGKS